MEVDVACPQCGTIFTINRDLLGKRSKCTKCGTVFTLAASAARSAAAPAAPSPGASNVLSEVPVTPPQPPPVDIPQFTIDTSPRPSIRSPEPAAYSRPSAEPTTQRFGVLRMVARAYEVMAAIALAVAVIILLVVVVQLAQGPSSILLVIATMGPPFFTTIMMAVFMLFGAQMIRLALQIEQNTRETSDACRRLAEHLCSIESER